MNSISARASVGGPCAVCGTGTKGCSVTTDGLHFCRGEPAGSDWKLIGTDTQGFGHYRHHDDARGRGGPKPKQAPTKDWEAEAKRYTESPGPDRAYLAALAKHLGLPERSAHAISGIGHTGAGTLERWTFPECDGRRRVIGLSWRDIDGHKESFPGSARGLSVCHRFWAGNREGPVFVVEGASDVMALYAVGLIGIGRPSNTGGGKHLCELLRDVPADIPIYVMGENDSKLDGSWPGRDGVNAIAPLLARELGRPIRAAFPPPGHKDCREWVIARIQAGGVEHYSEHESNHEAGASIMSYLAEHATPVHQSAPTLHEPGGRSGPPTWRVGDRVSPTDRDNIGTVVEVMGTNRYSVEFIGKEGRSAVKEFAGDALRPPQAPGRRSSGPTGTGPLPLIYFNDIRPGDDTRDFVEDFLLDGQFSVVFGEPGSGKTFFALDLALHVALGWPWQGRAVDRGGVIYLAMEGQRGLLDRVTTFRRHHGWDETDTDPPFAVTKVANINLCDPGADTGRLIQTIEEVKPKLDSPVRLVVVDTLARALAGGDENSSTDMGSLVGNCDLIRHTTGAHVMLVHHSGKDATRGMRGHSILKGAIDTEVVIAGGPTAVATVTKQRDLEAGAEFPFRLEKTTIGANRHGKPRTSCVVVPADPPPARGPRITGQAGVAYKLLVGLLDRGGQIDADGAPAGVRSIETAAWRGAFYQTKHDAKPDTKKKAFQGVLGKLLPDQCVLMSADGQRVWLAPGTQTGNGIPL